MGQTVNLTTGESMRRILKHKRPKFRGNSLLTTLHLSYFKPVRTPIEVCQANGILDEWITVNPLTGVVEVNSTYFLSTGDSPGRIAIYGIPPDKIKYRKPYRVWRVNPEAYNFIHLISGVDLRMDKLVSIEMADKTKGVYAYPIEKLRGSPYNSSVIWVDNDEQINAQLVKPDLTVHPIERLPLSIRQDAISRIITANMQSPGGMFNTFRNYCIEKGYYQHTFDDKLKYADGGRVTTALADPRRSSDYVYEGWESYKPDYGTNPDDANYAMISSRDIRLDCLGIYNLFTPPAKYKLEYYQRRVGAVYDIWLETKTVYPKGNELVLGGFEAGWDAKSNIINVTYQFVPENQDVVEFYENLVTGAYYQHTFDDINLNEDLLSAKLYNDLFVQNINDKIREQTDGGNEEKLYIRIKKGSEQIVIDKPVFGLYLYKPNTIGFGVYDYPIQLLAGMDKASRNINGVNELEGPFYGKDSHFKKITLLNSDRETGYPILDLIKDYKDSGYGKLTDMTTFGSLHLKTNSDTNITEQYPIGLLGEVLSLLLVKIKKGYNQYDILPLYKFLDQHYPVSNLGMVDGSLWNSRNELSLSIMTEEVSGNNHQEFDEIITFDVSKPSYYTGISPVFNYLSLDRMNPKYDKIGYNQASNADHFRVRNINNWLTFFTARLGQYKVGLTNYSSDQNDYFKTSAARDWMERSGTLTLVSYTYPVNRYLDRMRQEVGQTYNRNDLPYVTNPDSSTTNKTNYVLKHLYRQLPIVSPIGYHDGVDTTVDYMDGLYTYIPGDTNYSYSVNNDAKRQARKVIRFPFGLEPKNPASFNDNILTRPNDPPPSSYIPESIRSIAGTMGDFAPYYGAVVYNTDYFDYVNSLPAVRRQVLTQVIQDFIQLISFSNVSDPTFPIKTTYRDILPSLLITKIQYQVGDTVFDILSNNRQFDILPKQYLAATYLQLWLRVGVYEFLPSAYYFTRNPLTQTTVITSDSEIYQSDENVRNWSNYYYKPNYPEEYQPTSNLVNSRISPLQIMVNNIDIRNMGGQELENVNHAILNGSYWNTLLANTAFGRNTTILTSDNEFVPTLTNGLYPLVISQMWEPPAYYRYNHQYQPLGLHYRSGKLKAITQPEAVEALDVLFRRRNSGIKYYSLLGDINDNSTLNNTEINTMGGVGTMLLLHSLAAFAVITYQGKKYFRYNGYILTKEETTKLITDIEQKRVEDIYSVMKFTNKPIINHGNTLGYGFSVANIPRSRKEAIYANNENSNIFSGQLSRSGYTENKKILLNALFALQWLKFDAMIDPIGYVDAISNISNTSGTPRIGLTGEFDLTSELISFPENNTIDGSIVFHRAYTDDLYQQLYNARTDSANQFEANVLYDMVTNNYNRSTDIDHQLMLVEYYFKDELIDEIINNNLTNLGEEVFDAGMKGYRKGVPIVIQVLNKNNSFDDLEQEVDEYEFG